MLQTFGCYLHDGMTEARFVPILCEGTAEAAAEASRLLDADSSLIFIEVHPIIGPRFVVRRATDAD